MEVTLGKVLCGDELSDISILLESIRRLKDFCWDAVTKIRSNAAEPDDAVRGIAFAYLLDMLIRHYESNNIQGLDEADVFLAKEVAETTMRLSVGLVTGVSLDSHE